MIYHNIHVLARCLIGFDAVMLALTASAAWRLLERFGWSQTATGRELLFHSLCVGIAYVIVAGKMRVYHARRTESALIEQSALLQAMLCASGLACLATETVTRGLPPAAYAVTTAVPLLGLLASHLVIRFILQSVRRFGRDYRIWLVVGRNPRSAHIVRQVLSHPHYGVKISQIVDMPGRQGDSEQHVREFRQAPLCDIPQTIGLGPQKVKDILRTTVIDEVVVALPIRSFYDEVEEILDICGDAGIPVKLQPETFAPRAERTELSYLGAMPLVTHLTGPANPRSLFIKRVLDIAGSALGLLLTAPVLLLAAAAIKLTSAGPVFFRQTRVGLYGREFRILKFRTMVPNTDGLRSELRNMNDTGGLAFKMRNDPRVTSVGRILRKYHLDELPQLWNVLRGDMSLVGPRPLPPEEAFGEEWWQRRRLSMPPGLTCLWQVAGDHRIPFRRWMEMDLEYIDRWSLGLDLRLMVATLGTVARGTGW